MITPAPVRFLIVDGYDETGRKELESFGCRPATALYRDMLKACLPEGLNCEFDIASPADSAANLPQGTELQKYHGVAWTGSSLTIHKNEARVTRQIDLARVIYESGVPQFGSCWAVQIAAAAAGGVCTANPKGREFGLSRKITLTAPGIGHPMYRGKPASFDAFTVHYDMVDTAPPNAKLLAFSKLTEVQALDIEYAGGSFWAVQYHPEFDLDYIANLATGRAQGLIEDGHFEDETAASAFSEDWSTLHYDNTRTDLTWKYGIDDDILDPQLRFAEVRNWIEAKVLPRAQ